MKTFKLICATLLLAFSLSIPAFADETPGDGHTPGRNVPADPANPGTTDPNATIEAAGVTSDLNGMLLMDIMLALASLN